MAYSAHALVELSGIFTSAEAANESWSFGLRIIRQGGGFLSAPDAVIADTYGPVSTWFASAAAMMANTAKLTKLKINNINPDGTYKDAVTHLHDYGAGVAGTNSQTLPPDMSVCWSWGTSTKSRGRGARGRIYPPNYTASTTAGFYIPTATQTAHLTAAKNFLALFTVDTDGDAHLISPVIASKVDGTISLIDTVRVGRVVDVQRRRRRSIAEAYSSSTYP